MLNSAIVLIASLLVSAPPSGAAPGSVRLKIVDDLGHSVPDATVTIEGGTAEKKDGFFVIPYRTLRVHVNAPEGYRDQVFTVPDDGVLTLKLEPRIAQVSPERSVFPPRSAWTCVPCVIPCCERFCYDLCDECCCCGGMPCYSIAQHRISNGVSSDSSAQRDYPCRCPQTRLCLLTESGPLEPVLIGSTFPQACNSATCTRTLFGLRLCEMASLLRRLRRYGCDRATIGALPLIFPKRAIRNMPQGINGLG